MSLTITHGCYRGSCTEFGQWQNMIAKLAGYPLEEVGGVISGVLVTTMAPRLNWERIPKEAVYGEWRKTPSDPLVVLFAHSDCDGVIHPEQGIALANRLEPFIGRLPEQYVAEPTGFPWFDLNPEKGPDWKGITRQFIYGLKLAASTGEDVEFLG